MIIHGDCLEVMAPLEAESFHACVTDPPYGIGFMSRQWDAPENVAFRPETWAAVYRVLKPGAHLLAMGGTRTFHRLVCAIEDAGFEIRDTITWLYGSGFPKSHDFAAHRDPFGNRVINPEFVGHPQSEGWGTALKPACELICVARKPLSEGTVAANVLRHGTGALNIDASRVPSGGHVIYGGGGGRRDGIGWGKKKEINEYRTGRYPSNVCHDGSPEVMEPFAKFGERVGATSNSDGLKKFPGVYGDFEGNGSALRQGLADAGTAARFFFCAKADASERVGPHPTVKPVALMEWLVGLITPPGGRVLDPFCGTGSTLVACERLGFEAVGIEQDAQTVADAHEKIRRMRARRMIGVAPPPSRSEAQLDLF